MYTIEKHRQYPYVTIVSVPFEDIARLDFALCNQPTETPDAYYKRQIVKPDIITNGGFFVMKNGETCFGFRDEGVSKSFSNYNGVGITGDKTLSFGKNLSQQSTLRDFISAYPALVVNEEVYVFDYAREVDYTARRTAIGWNDNYLFIVTVDSPGLRLLPLSEIFVELGATYAINLDGGGSTRLLVEGKRKTSQISARPVDNVFCVYLNKETPKTIYRVQVGAYRIRHNAEMMKRNLISKGFKDAYVKKVDNLYKVQIGAFSVELNAQRLLDRVKALGYKSFITTK